MRAIQIREDDDRTLVWMETEPPAMGADQVRVAVYATAINRADLLQRKGLYPVPAGASPIMGLEMAGVITALGEAVQGWAVGDRVCALLEGGGYGEEVVCDASMLLPIPVGRSFEEAAAMPEALYTAYLNIWIEGRCQPGEVVMVHAAGSGVGTAAVQLCAALGHPCLATASEGKRDLVLELGATAFCPRGESFVGPARALSEGRGVDVVLDLVGANYLGDNLKAVALKGRIVVVGLVSGRKAELDLGRLLMRRITVKGSVLRSRSRAEKLVITKRLREVVWPLFEAGTIHPVIDRVMPIAVAGEAQAYLATNASVGKVVLKVR